MNSGRNNDTSNMKELLFDMLVDEDDPSKDLALPRKTTSKHDFGFHNYTMGELLCPANQTWSSEYIISLPPFFRYVRLMSASFRRLRQQIIDKKFIVDASEFPRFVYADLKYNASNEEDGLFLGKLGMKVRY